MAHIAAPASIRRQRTKRAAWLASGHRLFFLATGVYGALSIVAWLLSLHGYAAWDSSWHAHEMLYGFAAAGIGGFLSAAVPNWTRSSHFKGIAALALFALWVAGRVAMWSGVAPALDIAFLPVMAAVVFRRLHRSRNVRNYQVAALVLALAAFNVVWHLGYATIGLHGATWVIVTLVALIGGRVVPGFTSNAIMRAGGDWQRVVRDPRLDKWAVALVAGAGGLAVFVPGAFAGVAVVAVGLAMAWRSRRWGTRAAFKWPIVAVLHAAWWFVPVGMVLVGGSMLGAPWPLKTALHALTAGAIGGMLVAIATRASRGHSGRPLVASHLTTAVYILVIGSALVRLVAPAVSSPATAWATSGAMWALGWLLFAIEHAPMLLLPRADGKPG